MLLLRDVAFIKCFFRRKSVLRKLMEAKFREELKKNKDNQNEKRKL